MDKKELEQRLSKLMDDIPEIEGLIALDKKGTEIVGQTLVETDRSAIAKAAWESFNKAKDLGAKTGKGGVQTITISLDKGSICIVGNDSVIIISIQGNDAATSLSLIMRSIKAIVG